MYGYSLKDCYFAMGGDQSAEFTRWCICVFLSALISKHIAAIVPFDINHTRRSRVPRNLMPSTWIKGFASHGSCRPTLGQGRIFNEDD